MSKHEIRSQTPEHPYAVSSLSDGISEKLLYPDYLDPLFEKGDVTVYIDPKYKTNGTGRVEGIDYISSETFVKEHGWEKFQYACKLSEEIANTDSAGYFQELLRELTGKDLRLVHMLTGIGTTDNRFYYHQIFGVVSTQQAPV